MAFNPHDKESQATPPAKPSTSTATTTPQKRVQITKPPSASEVKEISEMWQRCCDERAEEFIDATDAYAKEWRVDDELARIDAGRGVIKLFPVMSQAQLNALGHRLKNDYAPSFWIAPTRAERAREQALRHEPMPDSFLADQVRGLRRDRLRASLIALKERRLAAEAAAKAAAAKAAAMEPPRKPKPRIKPKPDKT